MNFDFKKLVPHAAVFILFIVAALAYFSPVLSGKELYQSDIVQYKGNARQLMEHREQTGEELYWTDSVFGGMPTYQLGARYPYDFIDGLDRALRFLPRPADYLFLYFVCFYVLMLVMRVNWKIALLGALAFGFSTYLIIIIGAGHNSKAHAIAYFPLVLSGIILVFQKRYIAGFLLTAVAMSLELQANHPQMTYYLLLAVIIMGIAYLIDAAKKKLLPHYFKSVGIMAAAVLIALGTNAGNLLATSEYSKESTRGKSTLTINAQGENVTPNPGLEYDYITEYSYGLTESFNLIIPRFAGGGSGERPDEDSETVAFIEKLGAPKADAVSFANDNVPMYWGDQTIVEAPAYLGVSVVFLAILALFLIKGRLRWWTVGVIVLALLLSYGKNMAWLTNLFIDYMPLYNKFRAVTSVQVLIELVVPILAATGVYQFFNDKHAEATRQKALLYAAGSLGGLLLLFALLGGSLFDFAGPYDSFYREDEQLGQGFVDALRADRANLMQADAWRGLVVVLIIAGLLYAMLKKQITENIVLLGLGAIILFDLVSFNLNYVNSEDYVSKSEYEFAFEKTAADEQVLQDKSYFRVFDLLSNPINSGRAPYFHNALGGYHGAKPARFQELFDFYMIDKEGRAAGITPDNIEILSMFNVKYILDVADNQTVAKQNPMNMGSAWIVQNVKTVANDNEAIRALKELSGDSLAVITKEQAQKIAFKNTRVDSNTQIRLVSHKPQQLIYESINSSDALAVFSEMYYPHGWTATINGQEAPIARVNYALRGLNVPAGRSKITFTFEPQVVKTGSNIMLASNIILLLLLLGGGYMLVMNKD